jgi:simple sugar transport system ATP-binding protein
VLAARAGALSADALAHAMLGSTSRAVPLGATRPERARTPHAADREPQRATTILAADDLEVVDARGVPRLRGVSLEVRAGEIVGLVGVEGAGQHELLRVLAGRLRPTRGIVQRPDRIGFVPEDRHRDALVLDLPLYENVALRGAARARGRMPWRALAERTARLLERFDVRADGPRVSAAALSGGNQQKLVLARELDGATDAADGEAAAGGAPAALVVENPTRGLDLAASAAVHARLRAARDSGAAVVLYSSDLDEVLALADRLVVLYQGHASEIAVQREAVGRAMLGLA